MKVLISVAVWGREYVDIFAKYCLGSQLSESNIPQLSKKHKVTYQIITTRDDKKFLLQLSTVKKLSKYCAVQWEVMEDLGFDPQKVPTGPEGEKYSFLSVLQNHAIAQSLEHDALVFNYADFIWAEGSLTHSIEALTDDVDAVLSFCLPVDKTRGLQELAKYRSAHGQGEGTLDLPARDGADIAIRCLHREAKLRYWDDPAFTVTPTYLLWPVDDEGIIIRAYHQTILALRVRPDDPDYRNGIPGGSLDGYFTAILARGSRIAQIANSDQALVFSLYDTIVESNIGGPSRQDWTGFGREESLRECLEGVISLEQRKFALMPIEVRKTYDNPDRWAQVAKDSFEILRFFHDTTSFDEELYKKNHTNETSLGKAVAKFQLGIGTPPLLTRIKIRFSRPKRRPAERMPAYLKRLMAHYTYISYLTFVTLLGDRLGTRFQLFMRKIFRNQGLATAVKSQVAHPTADEIGALLLAGKVSEAVDLLIQFTPDLNLVPGVVVNAKTIVYVKLGNAIEGMLPNLNDFEQVNSLLQLEEKIFTEATQTDPIYPTAHEFLARCLWFQGRFAEALVSFHNADVCLPRLAKHAGIDPNEIVLLPRNCAEVIGLMGHIDAFIKNKILTGDLRQYRIIVTDNTVVNQAFLDYWKKYIEVQVLPPGFLGPVPNETIYTTNWNWVSVVKG